MRHPLELKEKAVKLRKKGYSLKEISSLVGVAKSTTSLWMRDIKLNKQAEARLKQRGILGQYKSLMIKRKKREELLKNFRMLAREEIKSISKNGKIFRLLCAIFFWCEGNKNELTHVRFTNSEPEMVKCFLYFLRGGFEIDERKLRALVHLHAYHNEIRQIDFWSRVTGIPKERFNKSYKKPNTGKRIKENYPGCLAISYYDASVAKKLWAYYKEVEAIFS